MFFSLFNIHRSMACDRTIATVVSIDLMRRRLPLFLFGITWLTVVQFDTHSASGIETLPDSISVSSTASLDAASESSTSSTVASSRSNSSLRSVTLKDFSRLMDMLSSGVSLSSAPKNGSCENVIRYNGFEYVCYEKVNFIFVMALILFVLFIVFTVFGNSLVILAILRDRRLRTPSTYLILSLAVTDLIVGLVTVPIRAFSELKDYGTWPYGAIWCDLRVVVDKMCVYASLLHLVAIALDRYLTVSSLSYSLTRSGKQILYMISVAWGVSFGLAAAPMFGWRDDQFGKRIRAGSCFVNTLFSLNLTVWLVIFVIPVLSILVLYYKVYQVKIGFHFCFRFVFISTNQVVLAHE